MNDLTNNTILVAGGAGYLGSSLCKAILSHNGNLSIADIDDKKVNILIDSLNTEYPDAKILSIKLDIKDESSIIECVNRTYEHFGSIDGLVNATFGATNKNLENLSADDFNAANEINLTGSFLLSRATSSKMKAGGSIVMFASMYGIVSPNPSLYPDGINPNPIEYGAGKAGLIQLTKYLAAYYGPKNIRVNAIAPGPFPNLVKDDNHNVAFINNLKNSTMLKRIGESKEINGPIIFLLSNASSYITGQVLKVDGGWTAW